MSINDALMAASKYMGAHIGMCHECYRSGILVKLHRRSGFILCARCADNASRRPA